MKFLFDIFFAILLFILLAPIYLIVIILIRLKLGSPVFFVQERPGKDGKIFKMIKFRTMKEAYDKNGNPLPDSERMTSFGNFLRKSSLDELPEILNVLKGEMSFVGPRPLLVEYLPLYNEEQKKRHDVKPGITGWAQINGRNAISWDQKFKLDVWYVENRSFFLDIKILFLTVLKVIKKSDITEEGGVTMSKFTGNGEHNE